MDVKKSLTFDAAILVLAAVSFVPDLTSVAVHEWAGLLTAAAFLVHVSVHLKTGRSRVRRPDSAVLKSIRTANLAVDAALFVVLAIVAVSGLGVSGAVLPTFGLFAEGYYVWNPLHALSAKILLALLVVHAVLHVRLVRTVLSDGRRVGTDAARPRGQ